MKYLFIFPNTLSRDMFQSQLKPIIDYLTKKESFCSVYFGDNPSAWIPGNNYSTVETKEQLNGLLSSVDYVYIRNIHNFFPFYLKKISSRKNRFEIIYNFRGFASYENFYGQKNIFKFVSYLLIEWFIYKASNHISVVSNTFKEELQKHFGKKKDVSVIPCCVETTYQKKRRDDELMKFVFCGSTFKWQKFEEIIGLFIKINKYYPNSQLIVFTKDTEKVNEHLSSLDYRSIYVDYLPRTKLLQELVNHDFGFLLRDNVKLNNVASPIKFAEYLSCGLSPILSPGIGDYSGLVKTANIGIVTDEKFNIDMDTLKRLKDDSHLSERIYNVAESLTWQKNLQRFPSSENTSLS